MRQIDEYINGRPLVYTKTPIGPHGSKNWTFEYYGHDDQKIVLFGPDSHGRIPEWIKNLYPKSKFVRRGGTTYDWSAWSVEPK